MPRASLPARRAGDTTEVFFAGEKYYVTRGFYSDGLLGEVFVQRIRDKAASRLAPQLEATCNDAAILLSLALQYGTPIDTIRAALTREVDGSPQSIIGLIADMGRGDNDA